MLFYPLQALARGSRHDEPTMRLLRTVMLVVAGMLMALTIVTWNRSLYVVNYEMSDANSIQIEGQRAYTVEVGFCGRVCATFKG